jgi:uncharacterized protein YuzE
MKFNYYPETDSLYIDLSEKTSADSLEISPGIVLDLDAEGNPVGLDIDRASKIIDFSKLEMNALPFQSFFMADQLKKAS